MVSFVHMMHACSYISKNGHSDYPNVRAHMLDILTYVLSFEPHTCLNLALSYRFLSGHWYDPEST